MRPITKALYEHGVDLIRKNYECELWSFASRCTNQGAFSKIPNEGWQPSYCYHAPARASMSAADDPEGPKGPFTESRATASPMEDSAHTISWLSSTFTGDYPLAMYRSPQQIDRAVELWRKKFPPEQENVPLQQATVVQDGTAPGAPGCMAQIRPKCSEAQRRTRLLQDNMEVLSPAEARALARACAHMREAECGADCERETETRLADAAGYELLWERNGFTWQADGGVAVEGWPSWVAYETSWDEQDNGAGLCYFWHAESGIRREDEEAGGPGQDTRGLEAHTVEDARSRLLSQYPLAELVVLSLADWRNARTKREKRQQLQQIAWRRKELQRQCLYRLKTISEKRRREGVRRETQRRADEGDDADFSCPIDYCSHLAEAYSGWLACYSVVRAARVEPRAKCHITHPFSDHSVFLSGGAGGLLQTNSGPQGSGRLRLQTTRPDGGGRLAVGLASTVG